MRRYFISLTVVTLLLVLLSFMLLWFAGDYFIVAMPLVVLYFGVITAVQHLLVTRAAHKDPRVFVKTFLGSTVAMLLLHLVVMAVYMFSCAATARLFIIAFALCYVAYLVFETVALVRYVKDYQKEIENRKH